MNNKASLKGMWLNHMTRFKFWGPIDILGMSNFVQRETISSLAKGMKNQKITPKSGMVLLT